MCPTNSVNKRLLITILGCVQGIGFRPFVYRLAKQNHLTGHIKNTNNGVAIDVQGDSQALIHFQKDLLLCKPKGALISEIKVSEASLQETRNFEIKKSEKKDETALALLPDTAICQECLQELFDPNNRRYRYPFLHCMSCGPRFSLFLRMPFDRENTSMADFSMCDQCQKEYEDPTNRRFYSQTNCCPSCGPKLWLVDQRQRQIAATHEESIQIAITYLQQGKIIALKNTGGYILLADATNETSVKKLRHLKRRAKKPFALLLPDLTSARKIAQIDQIAEKVLTSRSAPIVLLTKTSQCKLTRSVAFDSPYYGIMLPHNAIHFLLLNNLKRPLIATSGNISGNPLCITEEEAFKQLSIIVDAFLIHNRRIIHRVDDSIVHIIANRPMLIRRARGYIPYAIDLPQHLATPSCLLAAGSHLKNSFAIAKNHRLYLSQYMGNLDSISSCKAYDLEIKKWEDLLKVTPSLGIGDKHPHYYTTHYLQKRKINTKSIQHHKAHVYSAMIDNQLSPPFLSFSWDGTGFGDDNTIWGGEVFLITEDEVKRFATLYPFRLPGAEKAVKEPRRSALGLLHALCGSEIPSPYKTWAEKAFTQEELKTLLTMLNKGINAPLCHSMGRLFDAISALFHCCLVSDFEGQAALALETLACPAENSTSNYRISLKKFNELWLIDWRDMIKQIFKDISQKVTKEAMAFAFHQALVQIICELAKLASLEKILLTGGVMQNKLLAEKTITQLKLLGYSPFWHHQIPPNDGGLAVGQIVGSIYQKREKNVPCFTG